MEYFKTYIIGGLICVIGQILIDKTKLTPARILVAFVTTGAVLEGLGIYKYLVDFAGAGATVPLTGFGYNLAKGAVKALDAAGLEHGVGKDIIVMGFDCNKWALEELKKGNWNYDGQCNPFQASYLDDIIKKLEKGEKLDTKVVIMEEKGFDAKTITDDDVKNYGI